jgi:protein gp37
MPPFPDSPKFDAIRALLKREGTGISWTHLTFNPWIGCQKVSPACDNCYAEVVGRNRLNVEWGPGAERRRTKPATWAKVMKWQRIAAEAGVYLHVFCASLADWADNAVPDQWRDELAETIMQTPNLIWKLLTKRIGNARAYLERMFPDGVPRNVWLGVTIANQAEADRDLPKALSVKTGLGIRRLFLSCEPLLGPLDLTRWLTVPGAIDQVIVGGESGQGARPMPGEWPDNIQMDCEDAGVAFHFKQWGEWLPWYPGRGMPDAYVTLADGTVTPDNRVGSRPMAKVGVRRAGRTLRGKEFQEMPSC